MEDIQLRNSLSNDTVFNIISKTFISLPHDKVKKNNMYLQQATTVLIDLMKLKDPLFAKAYKQIIFCGSFYKGTKVGHPNEYDLNIVLELPIPDNAITLCSTRPAFTKIHVNTATCVQAFNSNISPKYVLSEKERRLLQNLIRNDFLDPDSFRQWVEGILSRAVNDLPKHQNKYELVVQNDYGTFIRFTVRKSGPAFTLILNVPNDDEAIHIDFAPTLAFNKYSIHGSATKLDAVLQYRNKTWFAITLPLNNPDSNNDKFHWRLSFCHQEREILAHYGRMKPVIRFMKKLRDVENWKSIASYYIETLCLHKVSEMREDLNKLPLTLLFFRMLKELHHACVQHELRYFWDNGYNLLEKVGRNEMCNIACRLNNIIQNISKGATSDTFIIAKYVLNIGELQLLHLEYHRRQNETQDNNEEQTNSRCALL
ncbi:cGAS-like receptor 1 isoform X2 [Andrena cerasifolii]